MCGRGKLPWGAVMGRADKGGCLHSGAEHEDPDLLKDELQLYGGKSLSSGFGENGITQRTRGFWALLDRNEFMRVFHG